MTAPDRFRFLGIEAACATTEAWNEPARPALWTYNLHYFDDLNASGADARNEWHHSLIARWIAQNPPGAGAGWDPYPISRRLVNWIKWARAGRLAPPGLDDSLAIQARWLGRRLEYHLLGNHIFANAKALVFAGLHFEGAEAATFLHTGLRILEEELREQVLADGGHFERSTMYHASTLEDLLDLVNVLQAAGRTVPPAWLDAACRMQRWLEVMSHPDGAIAFFNDAAFGIAPVARQLRDYSVRLGHDVPPTSLAPLESLRQSGFVRLSSPRACILADVGDIGPDHQPGHAHADTLSFELTLDGRRLLVNSGTSEYGISAERTRQRGTAAHNTVTIDGHDSSEMWAGFRVARRARGRVLATASEPALEVTAEHDGYRRLRGRNIHRRRWALDVAGLRIEDEISGAFGVAEAHLHVHPDFAARELLPGCLELRSADGPRVRLEFQGADSMTVEPGTWHPRFGEAIPNQHIVARFTGGRLRMHLLF